MLKERRQLGIIDLWAHTHQVGAPFIHDQIQIISLGHLRMIGPYPAQKIHQRIRRIATIGTIQ